MTLNQATILRNNAVREAAIQNYLKNPKICPQCNTTILPRDGEKIFDIRKRRFCGRKCVGASKTVKQLDEILRLRAAGMSYAAIAETTGVSQSTVANWTAKHVANNHDISRSNNYAARRDLPHKSEVFRSTWASKRKVAAEGYLRLMRAHPEPGFIHYVAGLYDGEGSKTKNSVVFVNSNPKIISAFIAFTKIIGVRCQYSLNLHKSMEAESHIHAAFWQTIVGADVQYIRYDRREHSARSKTPKPNYHGVFAVRILRPIGVREALSEFSMARATGYDPATSRSTT